MNIKPIIVKSYLESLTEEGELNKIFPILLTSMDFEILSSPTENKGLSEYGKDFVAIGEDKDGIKKRFYFELKGGGDRDITPSVLTKPDGIIESIREAINADFETTYLDFEKLPKKIILVHNGELKGGARKTFKGFIDKEFTRYDNIKFERWGIDRLTTDFSNYLFGSYLLVNQESTKLFNKVLINLNASDEISIDFIQLLDGLFKQNECEGYATKLQRKWVLLFETLKLISLIIYTESKKYNNLDIAKRYLTHLIIKYWYWILKNRIELDKKVIKYFDETFSFYIDVLEEYFKRTLPIAIIENGLASESAGRYEEIGYTIRTFEYLMFFSFFIDTVISKYEISQSKSKELKILLINVINANSVSGRPLVDINSITIINVLNLFIQLEDTESATNYLKKVLRYIVNGKERYGRLPDANNSYESVIRFTLTGKKTVYYSDKTSPLLAVLMEYIIILNLKEEYDEIGSFLINNDIDLGIFTPHHGINSTSKHLIEDKNNDLEEQLFSNPNMDDGYQRNINLIKENQNLMSFDEFKQNYRERIDEFQYEYRSDEAGFSSLRNLAHIHFKISYFPDMWRNVNV